MPKSSDNAQFDGKTTVQPSLSDSDKLLGSKGGWEIPKENVLLTESIVDDGRDQETAIDIEDDGVTVPVVFVENDPNVPKVKEKHNFTTNADYDSSIDNNLPETVTLLTTPNGGKLYLIGTAHFSKESQDDVSKIVQAVRPHVITVELCVSRVHVLELDEETILEQAKNLTFEQMVLILKKYKGFSGLMYILMLKMCAYLTNELGMAPGGEFRRAYLEAKKLPRCVIHLGDRPINITLKRALKSLSWWQSLVLGFHLCFSKTSITREEVERYKSRDFLEETLAKIAGEFPTMSEIFLKERDVYLTYSLQQSCLMMQQADVTPVRAVGVVGMGHVPGIIKHWGTVKDSDIPPIMEIPPPTLAGKILKVTIKASLFGAVLYVGYKIIPLPYGATLQSIKSSVEGLLRLNKH